MVAIKDKWSLNATTLKIIAVVLMVFDHIHQMWAPVGAPIWLTWLGRPVFPIFLFTMAESFHYTRSRKNLLLRLLLASWVMIILSKLIDLIIPPSPDVVLMNNAFATFFIATLYMLFYDILINGIKERNTKKIIGAILLCLVPILTVIPILMVASMETPPRWLLTAIFFLPNILLVEGGPGMVALGLLFYIFRRRRFAQILALVAFSALTVIVDHTSFQWMMVFAAIPMYLYNGEKGRGMKNFFYIFYPAHIYGLYIIAMLWKR